MEGEDPALLDDYLGGDGVAFVEWPAVGAGAPRPPGIGGAARTRGGEERRTIEIWSSSH